MSFRDVGNAHTLTISSGQTNSDTLAYSSYKGAVGFLIAAPDTLPEAVTVEVSLDGGSTFKTLQSGGSDVNPTAGDATPIDFMGWDAMRLTAGSAVAADRAFEVGVVTETG